MTCIECHSTATELARGDSGRYEKRCFDCGKEWGPFVSNQGATRRENDSGAQPGLSDFTGDEEGEQSPSPP